mmetsp:Transcript_8562/g.17370  ORF Transcript_8562/g.17370 Transcript_8562/m.17370 type:complete len:212 (+) Transcript_8562:99-734(+)
MGSSPPEYISTGHMAVSPTLRVPIIATGRMASRFLIGRGRLLMCLSQQANSSGEMMRSAVDRSTSPMRPHSTSRPTTSILPSTPSTNLAPWKNPTTALTKPVAMRRQSSTIRTCSSMSRHQSITQSILTAQPMSATPSIITTRHPLLHHSIRRYISRWAQPPHRIHARRFSPPPALFCRSTPTRFRQRRRRMTSSTSERSEIVRRLLSATS